MHIRRALLYMPGDDRHKIEKAISLRVDSICMDLEDGVAVAHKKQARQMVASALGEFDFGFSEKLVRINAAGTGLDLEDLDGILPGHPDGVVMPKVENLQQVRKVSDRIEAAELKHGWLMNSIRLIADVETARGMLALAEIASHPRLDALIFGAEDYAVSIAAQRSPAGWEVFTARSLVVMHARAFGLQAIDMICTDFRDHDLLRQESTFGQQMGYSGKQVIHPAQVAVVQEIFTPGEAELAAAHQLLDAFELQNVEGRAAFAVDGRMVDTPMSKSARALLEQAEQIRNMRAAISKTTSSS
jgi:citrate lyase beta subunit